VSESKSPSVIADWHSSSFTTFQCLWCNLHIRWGNTSYWFNPILCHHDCHSILWYIAECIWGHCWQDTIAIQASMRVISMVPQKRFPRTVYSKWCSCFWRGKITSLSFLLLLWLPMQMSIVIFICHLFNMTVPYYCYFVDGKRILYEQQQHTILNLVCNHTCCWHNNNFSITP